jgi:hypothetical protein
MERMATDAFCKGTATPSSSRRDRFGEETISTLRAGLEGLLPSLWLVLEPYPDGWGASVQKLAVLPYFPMVLHRGGFPDGS